MAYNEAAKNATLRYREKKNIVKLVIDMPAEDRERYKEYASSKGQSLKQYIVGLIEADIERDTPEG